jgi:rubrerythrin
VAYLCDSYLLLGSTATMGLLTPPTALAARGPQSSQTLRNLQTAYSRERNANSRYLACAQKADDERYREVAGSFRAAARAEEIHLMNHGAVIRGMGAAPAGTLEFPVVKSTRETLLIATKGEAYECETMYPVFIELAEAEGNREAARTFDLARKAEVQHFNLFSNVLTALANGWSISGKYYVCTVCGYTVDEPVTDRCVSCASQAEKYETVS